MRVTLIHPPTLLSLGNVGTMKPTLPLGLAYVASSVREAGHEVRIVDAIAMAPRETWRDGRLMRIGAGLQELIAAVPEDSEVIGVTCMFSFSWPFVRELLRALRAAFPGIPLVGGGEHFNAMPELCYAESPVDVLVRGEGEETFVTLLDAMAAGRTDYSDIHGLVLRQADGTLRETAERARRRDLDAIPRPAWDLFDTETYNVHDFQLGMRLGSSMPILATRGCPYQCTFCTSPNMWTTRWYARDPIAVVDEIAEYNARYGAVSFPFHDLTAVIRRDWIVAFSEELLRRKLDITWQLTVGTRSEAFDAEVVGLMVRSGCPYLSFAPESGSAAVRKRIKKGLREDRFYEAVRVAVAGGLHVTCFFIAGMPFDTHETLHDTLRMVRILAHMGVEDISCHFFYPSPGTELFRELEAKGQVVHSDATLMTPLFFTGTHLKEENNYCEHLSAAELTLWRYRIFAAFYGTRFSDQPQRLLSLIGNVLRDRETNKLEAFARELRSKVKMRLRPTA